MVQLPLHASELTNHSPVALLCAKKVGCPQPDFPRVPEIILVPFETGSKRHAPSCPHSSYCAYPTSNGLSLPFGRRSWYVVVSQTRPDHGETAVMAMGVFPVLATSSQRTITGPP